MYFFKDTNGNWIIGASVDTIVSKVPCILRRLSPTSVEIKAIKNGALLIPVLEVTAIKKNAEGDFYANYAEFVEGLSGFFDNAPITAEEVDAKIGAEVDILSDRIDTVENIANASIGGSLGSIKPTDAAPTPARNGNYTFSIGGNKPAWLTAEPLVTTVKAGDGVAVVYDGISAYTYTHIAIELQLKSSVFVQSYSGKEPDLNTATRKLKVYAGTTVIRNLIIKNYVEVLSDTEVDVAYESTFIFINKTTRLVEAYPYPNAGLNAKLADNNLVLFAVASYALGLSINGSYKINGFIYGVVLPDFNLLKRSVQPVLLIGASVARNSYSYVFTGNVAFLHGNGKYAIITAGTYALTALSCLVVSNVNKNLTYDAIGANEPKLTPTIKQFNAVTEHDIVLAWRGQLNDIQSIFDEFLPSQLSTLVKITTPHLDKTPLSAIFQKIYNQENLKVLFTGDSIFESSNWWGWGAFPFGTAFASKVGVDAAQPFQMTDKILSRKLYDLLMKHSLNTPIYRRFDYGSTFDYVSTNGTFGTDLTPVSKFFTENGTFGTWVSSQGNGITSAEYGANGVAAQIPMTLTDAVAAYTGATWYNSGATEGFTRKSYGANAYIEFTVPAGFSKVRVKIRKSTDGDLLTTTLTNCTGVATIDTDYGAVTHSNNSHFTDVEFSITNTGISTVIRLTKSADTAKCLAYWGAYYYNEPCMIVNNYAYGGCTVSENYKILPDLLKETYDFVVWEVQLLNDYPSTTYALSKVAIQNYCAALIAYGKPILAVIPQRGQHEGLLNADKMWGMAKSVLMANNIPYIDLGIIESSVITQIGRTEGLKYIYSIYGGVHPVGSGVDTLAIMFNSLINN